MLSAAALINTLTVWKRARIAPDLSEAIARRDEFDLAFANTVLFALLVSYHLNPHDLSILLLPIPLLLHYMLTRTPRLTRVERGITAGLLGILFLPPLHLWTLKAGIYAFVSLPLLALFLTSASLSRQSRTP